ncbi:DnaJ domain-containing protein [candidate division KSB3 bacterium]|uniref:DnaJ domain-containing protein n=1 Tax=candidate division KSB3 bacterium TaxID=2044937 RepID=A0A9D5JV53_9BACT|nr:DnaJ domain-containing protein [candidate division KSB3 bacterium]MBD3324486.1 DnaJ domain-containing protein [candidate division KSB3 bacterium]
MDEFSQRLHAIDRGRLKAYLEGLRTPCYESQLFQIAFPEVEILQASPLTLYQHHFVLFHLLYHLQEEFAQEQQYLFIHFMRTIVRPYPDPGRCRFFDESLALFCRAACVPGDAYCPFHVRQIDDTALDELSLRYFYADPENFYKLDEDTAAAVINGTWELLTHYDTYQQSLAVLGLADTIDLGRLKKRFKRLAKQYHPDRGAASHEKFSEINNAYQFLVRVIPNLQGKGEL